MPARTDIRRYLPTDRTNSNTPHDQLNSPPTPDEPRELLTIPPFGASPSHKRQQDLRIAQQNVNGCNTDRPCENELESMQAHQIDILGLNETKLSATNSITAKVANSTRRMFPNSGTILSSSTLHLRQNEPYLPGGTGLLYRGTINCRSHKKYADPLGRFAYLTIQGRGECEGILVMTVYRVIAEPSQRRTTGSSAQQHDALRAKGQTNPIPRKQVLTDISAVIRAMQQEGYHPLIMGDFNDSISSPAMSEFLRDNGLHDVVAATNDGTPTRTYLRSDNRLDYIFGDQHIIDATTRSGSLSLTEGDGPDHAMQFVDLDMMALLQYSPEAPSRIQSRQFSLSNPKKAHEFTEKVREQMTHQKLFDQIVDLRDRLEKAGEISPELIAEYESIDQQLTRIFLSSAESVRGPKDGKYQRSPALVHAGRMCTLWKAILSCITKGTEWTSKVLKHASSTEFSLDGVSRNKRAAQIELQKAREHYNDAKTKDGDLRAQWLEEQAATIQMNIHNVTKNKDSILKGMIACAKQRQRERRLSCAWKPEIVPLMSTAIPKEKWTYDGSADELFEFDSGLFYVHYRLENERGLLYSRLRTSKKPPSGVVVVDAEASLQHIRITSTPTDTAPTWIEIDNRSDLERWLLTRNKKHLQQVHDEQRPPSREPLRSYSATMVPQMN